MGQITGLCSTGGILLFVFAIIASTAIKIVQEYERGVIFRLGRLLGAKGPGLFFIIPIIDRMIKVDLRRNVLDIPSQDMITRDNVTVKVNAVAFYRVIDPSSAIVEVENYRLQAFQLVQTTLRSVVGQSDLDELLFHREKINTQIQQIVDEETEAWGVKVSSVEIKDVELPPSMQRAMARQAEAEREKRAKIIHADGEFQASKTLAEAASVIAREPAAIQLRYLQTLTEIAVEKNSTIIFPVPIEYVRGLGVFLETFQAPALAPVANPADPPGGGQTAGKCPHCGAQFGAKARFCSHCGHPLEERTDTRHTQ